MSRTLFAVLLLVCLETSSLRHVSAKSGFDSSLQLLRDYDAAPADAMRLVVARPESIRGLAEDIKGDVASPRRLRAVFMLELAFASLRDYLAPRTLRNVMSEDFAAPGRKPGPKSPDFVEIFNAAQDLAESVETDVAFRKAWTEAALSMLEGGSEAPPTSIGMSPSGQLLLSFLDRTAGVFPPGRLHLARAIAHERVVVEGVDYEVPTYQGLHQASAGFAGSKIYGALERARSSALAELVKACQDEPFRALAEVHVAQLLLDRAEKDDLIEAAKHVNRALDASPDPSTQYLAHLISGRVFAAMGRGPDATTAFAAAVSLIPHGDAAALSLAGRLYLEGDRVRSDELVRRVLAAGGSTDPWAFFLMPEYAMWEARLQAVREVRR